MKSLSQDGKASWHRFLSDFDWFWEASWKENRAKSHPKVHRKMMKNVCRQDVQKTTPIRFLESEIPSGHGPWGPPRGRSVDRSDRSDRSASRIGIFLSYKIACFEIFLAENTYKISFWGYFLSKIPIKSYFGGIKGWPGRGWITRNSRGPLEELLRIPKALVRNLHECLRP